MEMKRDIRVEKKEDNMCTSLLTAVVVLFMACLKHFSSVSYLIEQWRSLVFLLLNVVLLAVYFTSNRPGESTHGFKTRRGGGRLRMVRGKKKKTRVVEEPACSDQVVVEPREVIKKCVLVEETKRVCPEIEETVKDCLFRKKEVDFVGDEDEFEPGRLSNEELNERVEAFITTFRKHLVLDARRGRVGETDQKMRSKDSDIRFLGQEVTCSV
ncbi:hypothetical protein CARUB_v10019150mg [Capsella rubella]|uniref:Uncharacterized protein n=1 Tax=Capsella rubella TaxID=81985 RepID=R0HP85_9BRAS|nr:uncharacterized protein LOC17885459 [Capsella rubella]EOA25783.1 hypothetical protein CARUB_v10019150mg [Capsella rubella]